MKRRFDLYLKDILECIDRVKEYTDSLTLEDFKSSHITIDASVRNLEIIGEAVSQLPEEVKDKYADIPWLEIKSFRNTVIHKYSTVDEDILWSIIENKLDALKRQIENILEKESQDKE